MFTFSPRQGLTFVVALALWLLAAPQLAAAEGITLNDLGVRPTGIAWDADSNQLFVISDQDQQSVVHIFDAAGKATGELTFDAKLESPQALAVHDGYLWIGDIGDPDEKRKSIAVYAVAIGAGKQQFRSWDLAYPDGAHEAAAFAVSGKGRFYVVTAGAKPAIYNSKLNLSRSKVNDLRRVTDAPAGVTDATFLPDGETLILRTGTGVTTIDGHSFKAVGVATYNEPEGSQPLSKLGESVTATSATELLIGTTALRREPVPKGETTITPALAADPTPASESAGTDTGQSEESTAQATGAAETKEPAANEATDSAAGGGSVAVSRQGTLFALAAAAVLAVVAGGIAFGVKN
ncbi:MAG: hypothetical protein CSA64_02505 [Arachnia propionica]|nr:MAG: hypothetical protein CSA64_02505 [Arachnia propionica]